MGIAFRVAPPEVMFDSQVLRVQPPHPSAVVRYSMDATAPTASSPVCRGEIVTDRPEDFRFATFFADDLGSIAVGASNTISPCLTATSGVWPEERVSDIRAGCFRPGTRCPL